MKIHHALLREFLGHDQIETLCNRLVVVVRDDADRPTSFKTSPAGNTIQLTEEPRDVTCNTCQHVWRNIRGH